MDFFLSLTQGQRAALLCGVRELNICRSKEVLAGIGPSGLLRRALKTTKLNSQQRLQNQPMLSAPSSPLTIHLGQLSSKFPPAPSKHGSKILTVSLSAPPCFVGDGLTRCQDEQREDAKRKSLHTALAADVKTAQSSVAVRSCETFALRYHYQPDGAKWNGGQTSLCAADGPPTCEEGKTQHHRGTVQPFSCESLGQVPTRLIPNLSPQSHSHTSIFVVFKRLSANPSKVLMKCLKFTFLKALKGLNLS